MATSISIRLRYFSIGLVALVVILAGALPLVCSGRGDGWDSDGFGGDEDYDEDWNLGWHGDDPSREWDGGRGRAQSSASDRARDRDRDRDRERGLDIRRGRNRGRDYGRDYGRDWNRGIGRDMERGGGGVGGDRDRDYRPRVAADEQSSPVVDNVRPSRPARGDQHFGRDVPALGGPSGAATVPSPVPSFVDVYRQVQPGVVAIRVLSRIPSVMEASGSAPQQGASVRSAVPGSSAPPSYIQGTGTGVVIDVQGHVVTCAHVVAHAMTVEALLHDGQQVKLDVLGLDNGTDLALLRMLDPPDGLKSLALAPAQREFFVGEPVAVIGHPAGLYYSLSVGVVSGIHRLLPDSAGGGARLANTPLLQVNALLGPGFSGGPLLSAQGEVLGIISAMVAEAATEKDRGLAFAVPAEVVASVLQRLQREGEVERSLIGLSVTEISLPDAKKLGLDGKVGALITRVRKGGPAYNAGLRVGDVIIHWGGRAILAPQDLRWRVELSPPNSKVTLAIWRAGKELEGKATLESMNAK